MRRSTSQTLQSVGAKFRQVWTVDCDFVCSSLWWWIPRKSENTNNRKTPNSQWVNFARSANIFRQPTLRLCSVRHYGRSISAHEDINKQPYSARNVAPLKPTASVRCISICQEVYIQDRLYLYKSVLRHSMCEIFWTQSRGMVVVFNSVSFFLTILSYIFMLKGVSNIRSSQYVSPAVSHDYSSATWCAEEALLRLFCAYAGILPICFVRSWPHVPMYCFNDITQIHNS